MLIMRVTPEMNKLQHKLDLKYYMSNSLYMYNCI